MDQFLFRPGPLDREKAGRITRQLGIWQAAGMGLVGMGSVAVVLIAKAITMVPF